MAWYDEAVFYHIYPLGLLGAPKENEYGEAVSRLPELLPWIDHIREIGCNAIYIGPLFESVGHGYETTDYRKLDSRLGTNDDLKTFVRTCHEKGVRVIFDGVFNHVGRDFFAFKDLKEKREASPYRDWFCNVNFWNNNEYNDGFSYDNWGGYNLLVKLNQRNPAVRDYIAEVIRFWVSEFDVDGLRLDAADVLDFDFMKMLRWVAGQVKPDFYLMGEVIHGEYSRWVNSETLHAVTNYHLHKALFSGHNDHNYFEIAHTVKRLYGMGGNRPDGLRLYNFSDNHDVARIMSKLDNRADYLPVHILVYTLPGVPSVYYGSEFGIEGRKERGSDASLRPALSLCDFANALTDNVCTRVIAALGRARLTHPVLSYGDYREVALTTRQYLYTRNTENETAVMALNNDDASARISGGGVRDGLYRGLLTGKEVTVSGGSFETEIGPHAGDVFLMDEGGEEEEAFKPVLSCVTEAAGDKTAEENKTEEGTDLAGQAAEPAFCQSENESKTAGPEKGPAEVSPRAGEEEPGTAPVRSGAGDRYGLDPSYDAIDPDAIAGRSDYETMSVPELQVAILEKMRRNGPVDRGMVRTVMENVYPDSLRNWVKSFR